MCHCVSFMLSLSLSFSLSPSLQHGQSQTHVFSLTLSCTQLMLNVLFALSFTQCLYVTHTPSFFVSFTHIQVRYSNHLLSLSYAEQLNFTHTQGQIVSLPLILLLPSLSVCPSIRKGCVGRQVDQRQRQVRQRGHVQEEVNSSESATSRPPGKKGKTSFTPKGRIQKNISCFCGGTGFLFDVVSV